MHIRATTKKTLAHDAAICRHRGYGIIPSDSIPGKTRQMPTIDKKLPKPPNSCRMRARFHGFSQRTSHFRPWSPVTACSTSFPSFSNPSQFLSHSHKQQPLDISKGLRRKSSGREAEGEGRGFSEEVVRVAYGSPFPCCSRTSCGGGAP